MKATINDDVPLGYQTQGTEQKMNVLILRSNSALRLTVFWATVALLYRDNQANYTPMAAHLILTLETKLANFPSFGFIVQIVILSVLDTPRWANRPQGYNLDQIFYQRKSGALRLTMLTMYRSDIISYL